TSAGDGGLQVEDLVLIAEEGQIEILNSYEVSASKDAYLQAQNITVQGFKGRHEQSFSERSVEVTGGINGGGVNVGVQGSYGRSSSQFWQNGQFMVGGQLAVYADNFTLDAANIECDTLTGRVKNLTIRSRAN